MLDNDTLINIFIKDVPLALAIFDREMRYIYASARWRNDYGLGDRPLKGISHYDLFPEIPKAWREAHRQCLSGKYLRADTDRIEHLDGSIQWLRWVLRPWKNSVNEVGGIVIFTEDVSDRVEAENKTQSISLFPEENPSPVLRIDKHGLLLYANRAAKALIEQWSTSIDGKVPDLIQKNIKRVLLRNETQEFELQLGDRILSFLFVPIRSNDYVNLYGRDVTENKCKDQELRKSEAKYRSLFENIDQGFCIIEIIFDASGNPVNYRFLETNPSFEKQMGLINARDKMMRELAPQQEELWLEIFRRVAVSEQPVRFENHARQLHRWYDVFAFQYGEPEKQQVAILINDITERKKAEGEIIEARKVAEEASKAKSGFLANMSHEIRTPMTVFLGAIELLQNIDKDPKHQSLLKLADKAASHLLGLIDDILDFSRIEAGKVELVEEPTNLQIMMNEIFMMFRKRVDEKGIKLLMEISTDVPPIVMSDRDRLKQILINLTDNAIKFTSEGEVNITLVTHDDFLDFSVIDTGIGIPEEKQHLLFKQFSQIDPSFHSQHVGAGLGLGISRKLVELMGGQMKVQSREDEGSIFSFTIPMKLPESVVFVQEAQPSQEDSVYLHILLAEDDPIIAYVVSLHLEQHGWQTVTAHTGKEAVEKWREGTYDIILMDLQMPEMNGIEATKIIRKEETRGKRVPIIGFTAHAGKETIEMCLKIGMDQILIKPVTGTKLRTTIEKCLSY